MHLLVPLSIKSSPKIDQFLGFQSYGIGIPILMKRGCKIENIYIYIVEGWPHDVDDCTSALSLSRDCNPQAVK